MSDDRRLVVSLCGTFLKPEMQSLYRQMIGLRRWRTAVFTEIRAEARQFPFEPVIVLRKRAFRAPGNFVWRYYWKHLRGVWPPPGYRPAAPPRDFAFCDLIDRLSEWRPALVHVYYGHKARKFLPLLETWGGPFVVSFHGADVSGRLDKEEYPATLAEVLAQARLVMGRSRAMLEDLAALGCPREKLRLNRAPIPLERIAARVVEPPPDGEWRLVQACRLIAKKGIATSLCAMRRVVERWPRARFLVAGEGPLLGELREVASRCGVRANVEFLGWQTQEQLFALYASAHLFLHPSEMGEGGDREGVPNSLLEAMAAGLPAVATRHGGIPEAVEDGGNGRLVAERDEEALAGALIDVMGDPALLGRLSRRAASDVRSRFGLETRIDELEAVYDEAASR